MSAVLRRPITSGSRQAPDPYDQFLESRFLYRKHTARDASCLFRVIAEQMYDTQMLHYEVRLECVRFMTRKRRIFEEHVDGDFDAYLRDMTKPRTYGTLLELRAVCCMYRRNAILFEPFNMGSVVTYNTDYREHFMVFYTNEFHFDSVFHVDYIKEAAICQSICFKLLYKMLFKLPDVKYAVEAMLHPHTFDWGNYEVTMDARGYIEHVFCHDGRSFYLDTPENTSCILENYKLCNFHNSRFVDNNANKGLSLLYMCPNRYNSCVRQLIDDGITPFPYKVAKSLDTYMYRNVEFDSWNDSRKEAKRYNVYVNDYNFKIGAKCLVELQCDDGTKMYTCHIQKIYQDKTSCVVFVEHYGKKFVVPYVSLHPLPPDEFRPWAMPFRHRRHMQQRVHLSKHLAKPKQSKYRKSRVFDVTFFDGSKCDAMQYMDNYYGFNPLFHDEPQITEEAEQQPTTSTQQLQQQHKVLHKPSAEAGAGATAVSVLQQQQQPASTVAPAQYVNYLTPSWINSDYQQSDGCMYMHYGGYAPPPPPPSVSLQSQHPSLPPYGPAPFMIAQPQPAAAPPSTFVLPQFSSHSNSGANSYHNSCTNSIAGTSAGRGHDDRSLYSIGEDLPASAASDVVASQPYYSPEMHKTTYSQDEQMRLYANHNVHNFGSHNYHNNTDQQLEHNDGLTTPPPTPDVASTSAGIKLTGATEKERLMPKRNANLQKVRPKAGRPEPLIDLGKAQHLAHASMLPTPSPSPNTQGNKFVFYTPPAHTSPAAQAAYQPPAQMPASTYYAAVKAGHNPYAWPPMPPPPGAVNMFGVPCDVYNNYSPEQNGAPNAANYAPPRH